MTETITSLTPNETLAQAVKQSDLPGVMAALDAGADPNLRLPSCTEEEIRHLTGSYNIDAEKLRQRTKPLTSIAITSGRYDILEELLKRGANPNALNDGHSPILWEAVYSAEEPGFELLLRYGADPNSEAYGETILFNLLSRRRYDLIQLALDYGANINGRKRFVTLDFAEIAPADDESIASSGVKKWMQQIGKFLNAAWCILDRPAFCGKLNKKTDHSFLCPDSVLYEAVGYGAETLRLLIAHGADANDKGSQGHSVLGRAIMLKADDTESDSHNTEGVLGELHALLEVNPKSKLHANPNLTDENGRPIFWDCVWAPNGEEKLRIFMQYGADPELEYDGVNFYQYAAREKRKNFATIARIGRKAFIDRQLTIYQPALPTPVAVAGITTALPVTVEKLPALIKNSSGAVMIEPDGAYKAPVPRTAAVQPPVLIVVGIAALSDDLQGSPGRDERFLP